ncbi:tRNA (adenosine(37)-N6)-threonylcarbamoyltransferase complex dimerization subunit type 1 TsaB [Sphingomonas daechungensis]|uniref:tRNA (adenosine(37)-N6)-threonylcarbamoyltransferase complex dimerization subunit type 1 TsaB n=1 Tax=Sphingomonas daechungensis TaxID=1176646 RepID=UPI003784FB18
MILAIDTSTAACSAALFDSGGRCIAQRDEVIGRGHSERLVPMLDEMLEGRRADRIVVGVGPGSFTGIRVGIAAAQGLAIAWNCELAGMSSLALIAAGVERADHIGVAVDGGHGELFVQQFDGATLKPEAQLFNLPPEEASAVVSAEAVAGPAAVKLVNARGHGRALEAWPSASFALRLPESLRSFAPKPLYARAPDARPKVAA